MLLLPHNISKFRTLHLGQDPISNAMHRNMCKTEKYIEFYCRFMVPGLNEASLTATFELFLYLALSETLHPDTMYIVKFGMAELFTLFFTVKGKLG